MHASSARLTVTTHLLCAMCLVQSDSIPMASQEVSTVIHPTLQMGKLRPGKGRASPRWQSSSWDHLQPSFHFAEETEAGMGLMSPPCPTVSGEAGHVSALFLAMS